MPSSTPMPSGGSTPSACETRRHRRPSRSNPSPPSKVANATVEHWSICPPDDLSRACRMRWITDNGFDPRYTFWTRANVNEVFPEPLSPLGWDLGWEGACLTGWRDLYIQRFGMEEHELS